MALEIGDAAPDFSLPVTGGGMVSLEGFRGRWLVLYAYPKDDTSSCTRQALDFSAHYRDFVEAGVAVLGISPDPLRSHDRFKAKHGLVFPLAADETREVLTRYGLWVEKSMWGRRYMGVERSTFLIDPEGRIARIWRKVKVAGHVDEVLAAARAMSGR